ncbi:MAG: DUF5678 domain-containing protein [Chloroflexi bacterium]|nr:DUF5678 domain-containing protein [Chloroflexota bacterium]
MAPDQSYFARFQPVCRYFCRRFEIIENGRSQPKYVRRPDGSNQGGSTDGICRKIAGRDRGKEAFHRLHGTLLKNHRGEYIAIYNGQLIDHDRDRTALFKRIEENYPDQYVLIRLVSQTPEIVYEHRSMRWA